MPLIFYGNINLDRQELQNVSVEKVVSKPTTTDGFEGRLIFQTDLNNPSGSGALYLKNTAAGTETWLDLSGAGTVRSVTHEVGGGLNSTYNTSTDATVILVDYTSNQNIIRAAGGGTGGTLHNAVDLDTAFMLTHAATEEVKDVELTKVKTAIGAGVSRVINGNSSLNHIELDSSIGVVGTTTEIITLDSAGAMALKYKFTAADPGSQYTTLAALATQFLKCTSPNVSVWTDFVQYSDTLFNIEIDQTLGDTPEEYAKLKLMKNDGAGGASNITVNTISIKPLLYSGSSRSLSIKVTPHTSISGSATVAIGLSEDIRISNTFDTVSGAKFDTLGFAYPTANTTAALTVFKSETEVDGDVNFSQGGAYWPQISASYADYVAAPDDSMIANRNYVLGAINLTTAVTLQGNYVATSNPATGTSVLEGHLYVVTTPGLGVAVDGVFFWPVLLSEGDIIIANQVNPTTAAGWNVIQSNVDTATQDIAGICHFPGVAEDGTAAGPDGGWLPVGSWLNAGEPRLKGYSLTWPVAGQTTISPVITTTVHGRISAVVNNTTITSTNAKDETDGIPFVAAFDDDIGTQYYAKQAYAAVPDASDSYAITHTLGSDIIVDVCNAATGEAVFVEVVRTSSTVLTIVAAGSHAEGTFQVTLNAA